MNGESGRTFAAGSLDQCPVTELLLPRVPEPDLRGRVLGTVRRADQPLPVGREGQARNPVGVAVEGRFVLPRFRVPDVDGLVHSAGHQACSVRSVEQGRDRVVVALQAVFDPAGRDIPDDRGVVPAARCQLLAGGTKRHAHDVVAVTLEFLQQFAGGEAEDADDVVPASGGGERAVRTHGQGRHEARVLDFLQRLSALEVPDDQILRADGHHGLLVRCEGNSADFAGVPARREAFDDGIPAGRAGREGGGRLQRGLAFVQWFARTDLQRNGLRLAPQVVRPEDHVAPSRLRVPHGDAPQVVAGRQQ